jgi:hypothetical protein
MDDLPKLLWSGNVPFENVSISHKNSNIKVDKALSKLLKKSWEDYHDKHTKQGINIYDGTSYRLNDFHKGGDSLHLELSEIKFSLAVGISQNRKKILKLGERYYSRGLFIGGFLRTADQKFVLGVRGKGSPTAVREDFIGGVLSKSEQLVNDGRDLKKAFSRELEEEAFIASDIIVSSKIVALVLSSSTRVGIVTNTVLNIGTRELVGLFEERPDLEMDSLAFKDTSEMKNFLTLPA